ncbi:MAG: GAF domain-containing protein [Acidobacteria bacterium]|nr:MAG: GAF domain-containing protein [Acidobacteriota bacterium]
MREKSHLGLFKDLLLDMAGERSLDALLPMIVQQLAASPDVALARIWLMAPGDICSGCLMREECPDRTTCLHLVASAGRPKASEGEDWSRIDGDFRRMPLGVRKVGRVASTGETVTVRDIARDSTDIARPEWAEREGIRGFGGQPLLHQGEVLGVLAFFCRSPMDEESLFGLRMIADHAAAAIANARNFEEIERLHKQLELENEYLREEVREVQAYGAIVGASAAIRNVDRQIELVAPTDASVLILGESGTGKELVAREIHKRSLRADQPMIRVNCASIPKELYESEFFGHVKGAFTGALRDRPGRFEAADGGTMFLDEVGDIPLELQSKLLRVLQEGRYERIGEERTRKVDVRIIAATNRDLRRDVEAGRFRQDLYYRINVFPIEVAPLRARKEDIPILAAHFLGLTLRKMNRESMHLTEAHVKALLQYEWPGNVRELQNVLERAVIISGTGVLRLDLPSGADGGTAAAFRPASGLVRDVEVFTEAEMRRHVRANVVAALRRTGWRVYGDNGAARLLGIKPTTLASRMKNLGIKKPENHAKPGL